MHSKTAQNSYSNLWLKIIKISLPIRLQDHPFLSRPHAVCPRLALRQFHVGCGYFKLVIIAVMESKRRPPPGLEQWSESPLDRKIRELQEVSEKQSRQVRQLLTLQAHRSPHRSPRRTAQSPSPRVSFQQSKQETARTRYHYEDFLEEQEQRETQAVQRAVRKKNQQEPLPRPAVVEEPFENRQLDQQMQYFKSEEYCRYLEVLATAHSPRPKAPSSEKRSHQANARGNREQGLQQISRPHGSLHPTSFKFFAREARSPQNRYWRAEPSFPHPRQRSLTAERIQSQRLQPKHQQLYSREPPQCKPPHTPRNALKYLQATDPLQASSPDLKEQESSEGSLHKKIQKNNGKTLNPLPARSQREQRRSVSPSPLPCKVRESTTLKETRIQTYRRELQFCNRQLDRPARAKRPKKESKYNKYCCGFKISDKDKENAALDSASSSPSPNNKNLYEISFKIDRKGHFRPLREEPRVYKAIAAHSYSNHCYNQPKKQDPYQKVKLITEPPCRYNARPLQQSQTNSTATRTEHHTKRLQKISVISRSKLK